MSTISRFLGYAAVTAALILTSSTMALAANTEGQLDPTFGTGGRVVVPFDVGGGLFDTATAVAVQPDGKIVVVGNVRLTSAGLNGIGLVRLMPDGSLDMSFGTNGRQVYRRDPAASLTANQVIVQPDGKILVAGSIDFADDTPGFIIIRFKGDGSGIDSSFGFNGKGEVDVEDVYVESDSQPMALATDGSIFIAASFYANATEGRNILLYKYSGTGQALGNISFNISSSGDQWDTPAGLALQHDGKLLLAADVNTNSGSDFALVRLTTSPLAFDPGFNATGIKPIDFGNNCYNHVGALRYTFSTAIMVDIEHIWLAGTRCSVGGADSAVLVDIPMDSQALGTPVITTLSGNYSILDVSDLVLQHTSRFGLSVFDTVNPILVSSIDKNGGNNNVDMLLTRLAGDSGQRDAAFGSNGDSIIAFDHVGNDMGDDWANAAIRYGTGDKPVGYLIMVGSVQQNTPDTSNSDFAIVRVLMADKVYGNGFD